MLFIFLPSRVDLLGPPFSIALLPLETLMCFWTHPSYFGVVVSFSLHSCLPVLVLLYFPSCLHSPHPSPFLCSPGSTLERPLLSRAALSRFVFNKS